MRWLLVFLLVLGACLQAPVQKAAPIDPCAGFSGSDLDSCRYNLALESKNLADCDKLTTPNHQLNCKIKLGAGAQVCEGFKAQGQDYVNDCLIAAAKETKDPLLCAGISTPVVMYQCFAASGGNCDGLSDQSSKDACNFKMAYSLGNATLCGKIVDKAILDNCQGSIKSE